MNAIGALQSVEPPVGWAAQPAPAACTHGRIGDFLDGFSVEVTPGEAARVESFADLLPAGSAVYIAFLPGSDFGRVVETAARLSAQGMVPVPHIAARNTPDAAWLNEQLARLQGEAGVDQVLLIGGGASRPVGDFDRSVQILRTGLLDAHGITRIGVAGHPEGSSDIAALALAWALAEKNLLAETSDARFHIVTQFCFEAAPVIAWDRAIRAAGNQLPIMVGLPGCATWKTLMRYAGICGVGASAAALARQTRRFGRLAATATPDRLVADLARHRAEEPESAIQGAHFFPFGALARTAAWARAAGQGQLRIKPRNKGFVVVGFD